LRLLLPRRGRGRGLGGLSPKGSFRRTATAAVSLTALLAGCGDGGGDAAKPTPTPAETRSPAVAKGTAKGDLVIGLTEQNPNLIWSPGAKKGVAEPFARWQDDVGKLKPAFFRLVVDWPSIQPKEGKPANLDNPYDGCLRGVQPCASWGGIREQLKALASRQKQHKGGWEVLVVISGTPEWAAREASGCERAKTQPRSRAPKPEAMGAYRKLITDLIAAGGKAGVDLRYWSAWNEPNHPFFISPQRDRCSPTAKSVAAERYTELVQELARALKEAPGDQQYVLGELAGLDERKDKSSSVREFLEDMPTSVVCGSTILSQHGYVGGVNPVDDAVDAVATHNCPKKPVVWMTETGVGAPRRGEKKRDTPGAHRAACRQMHRRLERWYEDPRVTAAFQYTFREDDIFPTGLVSTNMEEAFPVLREWQAWGGTARPRPTDPPPAEPQCASSN
jgi:hypothetical protein